MNLQRPSIHASQTYYLVISEEAKQELYFQYKPNETVWFARVPLISNELVIQPSEGVLIPGNDAPDLNKIVEIRVKQPRPGQPMSYETSPDMIVKKTRQDCINAFNRKINVICDYIRQTATSEILFLEDCSNALNNQTQREIILSKANNELARWRAYLIPDTKGDA